jgi:hypothetical protein
VKAAGSGPLAGTHAQRELPLSRLAGVRDARPDLDTPCMGGPAERPIDPALADREFRERPRAVVPDGRVQHDTILLRITPGIDTQRIQTLVEVVTARNRHARGRAVAVPVPRKDAALPR